MKIGDLVKINYSLNNDYAYGILTDDNPDYNNYTKFLYDDSNNRIHFMEVWIFKFPDYIGDKDNRETRMMFSDSVITQVKTYEDW